MPERVYRAITALQATGVVNMMHIAAVVAALREGELDDVADWVAGNRHDYARGIMQGFEARPQ